MSEKLAPGLMRLNPRGEVVPCNYDFETKTLGHLTFKLPIIYTEQFVPSVSLWTRRDMWKALAVRSDALASLIINNHFLVVVYDLSIVIYTKNNQDRPQVATADTKLLFGPKIPVGFVRTCPEVKDVNIPPYLLFMDEEKRVSIGGGPLQTLSDAVACTDIPLYKSLITTNRSAVYMSSNGPKYL